MGRGLRLKSITSLKRPDALAGNSPSRSAPGTTAPGKRVSAEPTPPSRSGREGTGTSTTSLSWCVKQSKDALPALSFIISGQPFSKANSRRIVTHKGSLRVIKSREALAYADAFDRMCQRLTEPIREPVEVSITIHYASWRPDLDESLILDLMQGRIYVNDRQVVKKIIARGEVDKKNPRSVITVRVVDFPGFPKVRSAR